jgi:DNA-binding FadR family transcriptional regulator
MDSIQRPLVTTRAAGTDPTSRPMRVVEHAKVVGAIAARDADAARTAMLEHLAGVESTLLSHLQGDVPSAR